MGARVGGAGLKENTERLSMCGKIFSKVINIALKSVKQHSTSKISFLLLAMFFDQRHCFRQMR